MNNLILSLMLIFVGTASFSQTSKSLFVKLGGAYTDFQDTKFSANSYGGVGLGFKLGYEQNNTKSIWSSGLSLSYGKESPNTHKKGKTTALYPQFYAKYLYKINNKFSVGAHWDILGLYFRKIKGLDNNGIYYIGSSDLFVSGAYQLGKFNFDLDLGVLSFLKESTSFAFSASQNALEDGEFNYQNEKLTSPFGFKYYKLRSLNKQLNLRSNITYRLRERLSVGYQWQSRFFSEVEDHPVTIGNHQILVRYDLIHKTKTAKPTMQH